MRDTKAAGALDGVQRAATATEIALGLATLRRMVVTDRIDPVTAAGIAWRLRHKIRGLRKFGVRVTGYGPRRPPLATRGDR
jgi:hypothetical protein